MLSWRSWVTSLHSEAEPSLQRPAVEMACMLRFLHCLQSAHLLAPVAGTTKQTDRITVQRQRLPAITPSSTC